MGIRNYFNRRRERKERREQRRENLERTRSQTLQIQRGIAPLGVVEEFGRLKQESRNRLEKFRQQTPQIQRGIACVGAMEEHGVYYINNLPEERGRIPYAMEKGPNEFTRLIEELIELNIRDSDYSMSTAEPIKGTNLELSVFTRRDYTTMVRLRKTGRGRKYLSRPLWITPENNLREAYRIHNGLVRMARSGKITEEGFKRLQLAGVEEFLLSREDEDGSVKITPDELSIIREIEQEPIFRE